MIFDSIHTVLGPVVWLLGSIFQGLWRLTGSAGLSIIILALLVSVGTIPFRRWAIRIEAQVTVKKKAAEAQIALEAAALKGQARFRVIERAYAESGYNPIQSILLGLPFIVLLPFLISAIFLFHNNPALSGVTFLVIKDLSSPDHLFFGLNSLPFAMVAVSIVDSFDRFRDDRKELFRFVIITVMLFVLVYNMSAGLVLYWISVNITAFLGYKIKTKLDSC